MRKLYIVGPDDQGDGVYMLFTEDGYFLASHLCSHSGYAKSDLLEGREERLEEWKEFLKDGYTLEFANYEIEAELREKNKRFGLIGEIDAYKEEMSL